MGTHSKIILVAALTVGAFFGLGEMSAARAICTNQRIHSQSSTLQVESVYFSMHPGNVMLRSVALDEFEPEPTPPPKGTGGTGTR